MTGALLYSPQPQLSLVGCESANLMQCTDCSIQTSHLRIASVVAQTTPHPVQYFSRAHSGEPAFSRCSGQKSFPPDLQAQAWQTFASQVIGSPPRVRPISKSQSSSAGADRQNRHFGKRAPRPQTIAVAPPGSFTTVQGIILFPREKATPALVCGLRRARDAHCRRL